MTKAGTIFGCEWHWLVVCGALAVGEYSGFMLYPFAPMWPIAAILAVFSTLIGYGMEVRPLFWITASIALLGFCLALRKAGDRLAVLEAAHVWGAGQPTTVVFSLKADAVLANVGKEGKWVGFGGEIDGLKVNVLAPLPLVDGIPRAGEAWECSGWISGWDSADVVSRRKMWIAGKGAAMRKLGAKDSLMSLFLRRAKEAISVRMSIGMENDIGIAGLARAMLLGERDALSALDKRSFADSGTIHIFAISGLHVMVVAKVLALLAAMAFVSIRFAWLIVVPAVWAYVAMIGFPSSAVRAAAMASVHFVAPVFWRKPNGVVAWSVTFIAAHILNPGWIVDVGSGLSFTVMLALTAFGLAMGRFGIGKAVEAALFSIVAWAAGVPIVARVFGYITPWGVIASVAMVPMLVAVVVLEVVAVAVSFVSVCFATYVNNCSLMFIRVMRGIADVVSRMPYSRIDVPSWTLWECFAWYFTISATLWLVLCITNRRRQTI